MGVFLYFYISRCFFWERETGEAGKIRSDLKKCNESWSIGRGRLARETLAIKWRGLCDIMLVWYLPYCTSLKHLRMGCSFLVPAIDESNFVPAGKAVSQTPLSAVGRAPPPKNVL